MSDYWLKDPIFWDYSNVHPVSLLGIDCEGER